MKVLHIVEALGGGVTSALREYISATSADAEHFVAGRPRPTHGTGDDLGAPSVRELPSKLSPVRMVAAVEDAVRRTRPDVVHVHSSWAGAYARASLRVPADRVVYTPHCFGFERTDLSRAHRLALYRAEHLLARRTAGVAAVSPREAALAARLGVRRVAYVPQVVSLPGWALRERAAAAEQPGEHGPRYVTAGRICPQKDPAFFAATARELLRSRPDAEVVWLGGGTPQDEERLRSIGVRVTGWIERSALLGELARADVYVHSAAWEGSPMTILEAAELGVPVVARRIAALESLGVRRLERTPSALASTAEETAKDPQSAGVGLDLAAVHNSAAQREALLGLYEQVASSAR
ncbi:glycosyltransferase family 4 protein [Kineococcus auxinigenes]|uniref:glycosyltransferase family 4 protein n=1 Tax=unclassified Kineococcus TaxID=2621656 RepID=UPI003D7D7C45